MVDLFEDPKLFAIDLKKARDSKDAGSILEQLKTMLLLNLVLNSHGPRLV